MNNTVKLSDFKDLKKLKVISKDLEQVIKIMDLTVMGLEKFNKYSPVSESLAAVKQNRMMTQIYLNKCKNILNKKV